MKGTFSKSYQIVLKSSKFSINGRMQKMCKRIRKKEKGYCPRKQTQTWYE